MIFVNFLFIIFSCTFINLLDEFNIILFFILSFLIDIISFLINFYLIRRINWFIILIFNIFFCFISLEILLYQCESYIIDFFWLFHRCQWSYKVSCFSFRCLYKWWLSSCSLTSILILYWIHRFNHFLFHWSILQDLLWIL